MCGIIIVLADTLSGDVGSKAHKSEFSCMVADKLPYFQTPWVVYSL